jgi:two-component system, OmpR family, phosphate regulon sensor histidine kinase PhoR
MFFRLLFAFVAFGVLTAAVVVAVAGEWTGGDSNRALLVVLLAGVVAVAPAWYFARAFVRPFREIRESADRIAQGEYGQRIHGGVWRETRALADGFNEMSRRLADQIERLETEHEQLRAILGGMAEGVIAVGPNQRVLFANEAAGRMLDFDPGTAIDRPFWELTRQPTVQELLDKALRTGQPRREDLEFKKPTILHVSVYVAPLPGEAHGAIMVLDDTSELRHLERLRQDFVANVSHELKTPLAVMKACVETLLDGAVEDSEARGPFLQQISDQGERLDALIHDLLSLARIESGEEVMDFGPIPMAEMVEACLARHRPRAEAKDMTLEVNPPAEQLSVWADEEALRQILDNLVDNAVKYTQAGGAVRVAWTAVPAGVALAVTDNGPGIPERDLPRIFERFYRVDKARSKELGGTGLGLAIVKHLAQAMRGSVKAASQVGRGTTFTVTLPTTKPA